MENKLGDSDSDPILPNTALVKKTQYSTPVNYSTLFNSTSRCLLLPCSHRTCSVTVILGALIIQSVRERVGAWGILSIRFRENCTGFGKKLSTS